MLHEYFSAGVAVAVFSTFYKFSGTIVWPFLLGAAVGVVLYAVLDARVALAYRTTPKNPGYDSALITGSSKGIGFHLAKCFARDGFNLVLVAQDEVDLQNAKRELLEINSDIKVHYFPMDLTEEGAPESLFDNLTNPSSSLAREFRINHFVNNAADAMSGEFTKIPLKRHENIVRLNVLALTKLSHLFASWFKEEKEKNPDEDFRIMNSSSVASFMPGPGQASYFASKAYIQSLTIALHQEMKPYGVSVSALCPGLTMTDFIPHANLMTSNMVKYFRQGTPDEAAKIGYRCMMLGRRYAIVGYSNYLSSWGSSLMPYSIVSMLNAYMNKKQVRYSPETDRENVQLLKEEQESETLKEFTIRTGITQQEAMGKTDS